MSNPVFFGVNVDPGHDYQKALRPTRLAENLGLDHVLIQDHAYNPAFVDTWTLVSALAGATERIALGPNVMTTPLHLPAMVAKEAATLDHISNGRLILGLGAGASDEGVIGLGGPDLQGKGDKFRAFADTLHIIRGLWESSGESFGYEGRVFSAPDVRFGPVPHRRIPIITGAMGPQSLRLTGKLGDGISISSSYIPEERLPWFREQLNAAAEEFGRDPDDLRLYYNVMGFIDTGSSGMRPRDEKAYWGDAAWWINHLGALIEDAGVDGFTYWPLAGDFDEQFRLFAEEIVPALRDAT